MPDPHPTDSSKIYDEHRIIVDLRQKHTELGWSVVVDQFFLAVVPWLFSIIGWVLIIGGLRFIGSVGDTVWVTGIADVLGFILFWYFLATFWRFELRGIPLLKTYSAWRNASTLLAFLMALGAWQLSKRLAEIVAQAQIGG